MKTKAFLDGMPLLAALAAILGAVPCARAQQTDAKVTTVPPKTSTVLPFEPFRYQGNVGRTLADSDAPQFPQLVRDIVADAPLLHAGLALRHSWEQFITFPTGFRLTPFDSDQLIWKALHRHFPHEAGQFVALIAIRSRLARSRPPPLLLGPRPGVAPGP